MPRVRCDHYILANITHNISIQINGNKQNCWKIDLGSRSQVVTLMTWPDRTIFCQNLQKRCSDAKLSKLWARSTHRLPAISEKKTHRALHPPRAGVGWRQDLFVFVEAYRLSATIKMQYRFILLLKKLNGENNILENIIEKNEKKNYSNIKDETYKIWREQ